MSSTGVAAGGGAGGGVLIFGFAGAPVAGAFTAGQLGMDTNGRLWLCTVAGTPGTWVIPGPGVEVGYVFTTASSTHTGDTVLAAITNLPVLTIPMGANPYEFRLHCPYLGCNNGSGEVGISIIATSLANLVIGQHNVVTSPTANRYQEGNATGRASAADLGVAAATAVTFTGESKVFNAAHTVTINGAAAYSPVYLKAVTT
jgi:hypothetical protein